MLNSPVLNLSLFPSPSSLRRFTLRANTDMPPVPCRASPIKHAEFSQRLTLTRQQQWGPLQVKRTGDSTTNLVAPKRPGWHRSPNGPVLWVALTGPDKAYCFSGQFLLSISGHGSAWPEQSELELTAPTHCTGLLMDAHFYPYTLQVQQNNDT